MTDPSSLGLIKALVDALPGVRADQYIIGVSVTLALYDWIMHLPDEAQLIWVNKSTKIKALYMFMRYTVIVCLLFSAYVVSGFRGPLTTNICVGWVVTLAVVGNTTLVVGNYTLIMQVYSLWDYRKRILRTLMVGYIVLYAATCVFSVQFVVATSRTITYVDTIVRMCVIQKVHWTQIAVWACQMAFDLFVLAVSFLNAADRPVKVTARLIDDLCRDGGLYYVTLFCLRLTNIVLCSFNSPSWFILGYSLSFAMVNVIMTRLILRIEFMRLPRKRRMQGLGVWNGMADEYELHVLAVPPQGTP